MCFQARYHLFFRVLAFVAHFHLILYSRSQSLDAVQLHQISAALPDPGAAGLGSLLRGGAGRHSAPRTLRGLHCQQTAAAHCVEGVFPGLQHGGVHECAAEGVHVCAGSH